MTKLLKRQSHCLTFCKESMLVFPQKIILGMSGYHPTLYQNNLGYSNRDSLQLEVGQKVQQLVHVEYQQE